MKVLNESRTQRTEMDPDLLQTDLLQMIIELRKEKTEIDEAIEALQRLRSSKARTARPASQKHQREPAVLCH